MKGITEFFELTSNLKNYYESEIEEIPEDYKNSYGDIGKVVGGIKYIDWSIKSSDMQIIKCENEKKYQYLLKRIVISCNLPRQELFSSPPIKDFIIRGLSEYVISKIVAGHPCGINSLDFLIVRLISQNLLIMEFLMEDAGNTIKKTYLSILKNPKLSFSILSQSANALAYLEYIKCPFHDITMDNFVVDKKGNLRLISYEIGQITKNYITLKIDDKNESIAYTEGYVSPEIYSHVMGMQSLGFSKLDVNINDGHSEEMNISLIDHFEIWSSNVYAWGMMALLLLGVIPDLNTFKLTDKKKSEKENKDILLLINNLNLNETLNENCSGIMKIVLKSCLDYDPSKRVPFGYVNQVLSNITSNPNKIDIETTKKGLYEAINRKGPIITNNDNLAKQIMIYEQKINETLNDKRILQALVDEKQNELNICRQYITKISSESQHKDQEINQLNYTNSNLANKIQTNKDQVEQYKNNLEQINSKCSQINNENENLYKFQNDIIKILTEKCNYKFTNNKNLVQDFLNIIEQLSKHSSSNLSSNQNVNTLVIVQSINSLLNFFFNNIENENEKGKEIGKESLQMNKEDISLKPISNINEIPGVIDQLTKMIKSKIFDFSNNQNSNLLQNENEKKYPEKNLMSVIVKSNSPNSSSISASQNLKFQSQSYQIKHPIKEEPIFQKNNHANKKKEKKNTIKCNFCEKEQNLMEMKECFRKCRNEEKESLNHILIKNKVWDFSIPNIKSELRNVEIQSIFKLIQLSKDIQLVNFGETNEFDFKCGKKFLKAVDSNSSLKGLVFFKKFLHKDEFKNLLWIFLMKKNLVFIIFEKNGDINTFINENFSAKNNKNNTENKLVLDNWKEIEILSKDPEFNFKQFHKEKSHFWLLTKR